MNIMAIVQARMGSSRLPGKVMRKINEQPMIELLLRRLSCSKHIDKIVIATTLSEREDSLIEYVNKLGYEVFQGSENDVLGRYYQTARLHMPDLIVRITGDCPLVDPQLVDQVIEAYIKQDVDFLSNTLPPTYPDGLDVAVFSYDVLKRTNDEAITKHEREHVSPYMRESGKFKLGSFSHSIDYSSERWTVDDISDLAVVTSIFKYFSPNVNFTWQEVITLRDEHPQLFIDNKDQIRNEGAGMSKGQKLWKRAKQIIPGGNMLLSKRAEMFLPEQWPAYFSRAKGCKIWDLEGNQFIDMSIMGIGTNTLGYGHSEVDESVRKTVDAGNMSTFNCPEEVYLAEKLIDLHPWADMVRFARTGGEANAIAIRIARAASGKEKVAICGYHGWHDWYLASNLGDDENLAGHLLPGLEPKGVPESLRGTVFPFTYNNYDELETLVKNHDIGVVKMEVSRNQGPEEGFLEKVRQLTTDNGIVLIFDECTSGFRQALGGLHKLYGVEPDMAMFGKALGNGYAITATIGRREVMEAAQTSFISSTFWTERIGPTAALKTLEVMEREKSWDIITTKGNRVCQAWQSLAASHDLKIQTSGLPAISSFRFESPNMLQYKTLITQEMLAKGYLASNVFFACTEHTSSVIDDYLQALDPIFGLIGKCEDGLDINTLLKGPVCHSSFKRLN